MIDSELDAPRNILLVRPESPLEQADFVRLAEEVDPQIESSGYLSGLIIDAPAFPGWQNFGAMVTHFRFIRDHQKHVKKAALVTDSALGDIAEHLTSHFVSAEIKHFPAGQVQAARDWIANESP